MKPTRRMWISAGIVGVVLAGGASVAAVASAGRIDQAQMERAGEARLDGAPFSQATPTPAGTPRTGVPSAAAEPDKSDPTQRPEDFIVSHEINPTSPSDIADYWTRERMEDAQPLPMPVVTVSPTR